MKPKSLNRIINLFTWTISALVVACLGPIVNYVLGQFDPALGRSGSLLISLALCGLMVIAGMLGYATVASFSKSTIRSLRNNIIAGIIFSVCTLGTLFLFGSIFPVVLSIVALFIPIAFGALSCIIIMRLQG